MATQDMTYSPGGSCNGTLTESQMLLNSFWQNVMEEIRNLGPNSFKVQELPLARIKKIMKLDEDVKMISAEAPVLFAKASEMFISELSLRAWIHTEDNKRRTLQRNDISQAISKFDQFDFLIDIVPRDELKPPKREDSIQRASLMPDQVQYYFQLQQQQQQQQQAALQQQTTTTTPSTTNSISTPVIQQTQQQQQAMQVQVLNNGQQVIQLNGQNLVQSLQNNATEAQQPQIIQLQTMQGQQQSASSQIMQQIVTQNGEVQSVPMQLSASQFQALQLQLNSQKSGQPIVLQTSGNNSSANQEASQQYTQQPLFQIQNINGQQMLFQAQPVDIGDQSQADNHQDVS